ncbi:hypothetical protein RSAG8_05694, partial [Rhizoctonia solani AG-8 WAC10335]
MISEELFFTCDERGVSLRIYELEWTKHRLSRLASPEVNSSSGLHRFFQDNHRGSLERPHPPINTPPPSQARA